MFVHLSLITYLFCPDNLCVYRRILNMTAITIHTPATWILALFIRLHQQSAIISAAWKCYHDGLSSRLAERNN